MILEPDPCEPNPCQHGGRCTDFNGQATCECDARYSGEKCQGKPLTSCLMLIGKE